MHSLNIKKPILSIIGAALLSTILAGYLSGCTPPKPSVEVGSRVVVLDYLSLEILHKLDVDVVGVPSTGYENIDEKYGDRDKYIDAGLPMKPNYTDIALIRPSEVIMSDATEKAFGDIKSSFEALGIRVVFFDYNGIPELKTSIMEIGKYFNRSQKATEIVTELEIKESAILERIVALENKPRVMVLFGAPLGTAEQSIQIAGNGLFVGSIVSYCGAVNVIEELFPGNQGLIKPDNWAPILDLEPAYIFCTVHGSDTIWDIYDSAWATSIYSQLSAAINGNIYYIPENILGVIPNLDYVSGSMQYILDIFEGNIKPYDGGYKSG